MPSRSRPDLVCCCCSNLTGCIVIACLFGAARIIYSVALYLLLETSMRYNETATKIFIITETFLGLSLIADILLLIGSIKKIKGFLVPWMVFAGLWIGLSILGSMMSGSFSTIIGTGIGLALTIWAMVLVAGGIKEIGHETSNNMELRRV